MLCCWSKDTSSTRHFVEGTLSKNFRRKFFVEKHFVDKSLRRQDILSKGISSKSISSTNHFVDKTFRRKAFRRQVTSSTRHFVDGMLWRKINMFFFSFSHLPDKSPNISSERGATGTCSLGIYFFCRIDPDLLI